jgi:hypothetical protein
MKQKYDFWDVVPGGICYSIGGERLRFARKLTPHALELIRVETRAGEPYGTSKLLKQMELIFLANPPKETKVERFVK